MMTEIYIFETNAVALMAKLPLLSIVCFTLLFSCSKEEIDCFTPPEPINLRLVDKGGNDLLDPVNPNGYKFNNIKLYFLIDGKKASSQVKLDSLPNTKSYFLNLDIAWNADKGRDFILELTPKVSDNIYLRYDHISERNCAFFRFVELKYNNVSYSMEKINGNFQAFEVVK